jgi:hypothetical protein
MMNDYAKPCRRQAPKTRRTTLGHEAEQPDGLVLRLRTADPTDPRYGASKDLLSCWCVGGRSGVVGHDEQSRKAHRVAAHGQRLACAAGGGAIRRRERGRLLGLREQQPQGVAGGSDHPHDRAAVRSEVSPCGR